MKKIFPVFLMMILSTAVAFAGSITIISPNGGENLVLGTTTTILYSRSGITNPVRITLWRNGVKLGTIADNLPANGIYSWPVGLYDNRVVSCGDGFKIKVKEKRSTVSGISESSFTIRRRGWRPPEPPAAAGIDIFQPGNDEVLEVGQARIIKWRTPEGSEGNSAPIMLTLWQIRPSRFRIIGRVTNQPGENQHTWVINTANIFGPGRYRICIHLADQTAKLAEGPEVQINLPERRSSEETINNDLEIGPVTPDCIRIQRVSGYGGGSAEYDLDKFRFRVFLKIRNNSWNRGHQPRPVINNVRCKYELWNRNRSIGGQRIADRTWTGGMTRWRWMGEVTVGPFESKGRGEWTTCVIAFSCFLYEEGYLEERNIEKEYYLKFELLPDDSVNDPNLENNEIRSSRFGHPTVGNAGINAE